MHSASRGLDLGAREQPRYYGGRDDLDDPGSHRVGQNGRVLRDTEVLAKPDADADPPRVIDVGREGPLDRSSRVVLCSKSDAPILEQLGLELDRRRPRSLLDEAAGEQSAAVQGAQDDHGLLVDGLDRSGVLDQAGDGARASLGCGALSDSDRELSALMGSVARTSLELPVKGTQWWSGTWHDRDRRVVVTQRNRSRRDFSKKFSQTTDAQIPERTWLRRLGCSGLLEVA